VPCKPAEAAKVPEQGKPHDPFVCHLCPKRSMSRLITILFQYCLEPLSCPKPHQPGSEIAKGGGEIAKVPDQTEATLQSL